MCLLIIGLALVGVQASAGIVMNKYPVFLQDHHFED